MNNIEILCKKNTLDSFFYNCEIKFHNTCEYINCTELNKNKSEFEKDFKKVIQELTFREKEVLNLIGLGFSSNKIAEKLFISKKTVDYHRCEILKKLNSETPVQLIIFAIMFVQQLL